MSKFFCYLINGGKFPLQTHIALSEESQKRVNMLSEDEPKKYLEEFFSLDEFVFSEKERPFALGLINKSLVPIVRAMTYINENFGTKITSDDLAEASSLCRTNFFKKFRKYLGITHTNYLMMIRVSRAQYALVFSEFSLPYISNMCGFATPSYMSKCYKKYKGFSPKHDREKIKIYKEKYPLIHISHDFLK